jgi:hypothetical protein
MPVSSPNKEYNKNIDKWQLVRDCDEGSKAVKAKKTKYLPQPNPEDSSNENAARYDDYVFRANFVNFVASTKEGLLGMVFRKETKLELDSSIDYLKDNIDGNGLSTDQMIKAVSGDVFLTGRYGLLTDYPPAPSGLTQAEVIANGLRANIKPYPAESVLSWRTETFGGITKNSSIVLVEPTEIATDDQFVFECVDYHRHLMLKDGVYVQNLYNEDDELIYWDTGEVVNGEVVMTADIIPRKSDGSTWDEITFQFIGADNNDSTVDKAPLYDIAEVNISHYQNSADFEESSFMVGQPTPVFAGLTQTWVDKNMKNGVALGSRGGVLLPDGGSGELLQADPNQMPEKGMERKEQQMVMIGARLIQDSTGNETAEGARIRFGGQNSKVSSVIVNVENGFKSCFNWALQFMGGTAESEIEINKELYDATLDPQLVMAGIQLMDRGVIAKQDLQDNLRAGGFIKSERTNEDIDAEAEETVMGGDFGGGDE